MKDFKVSVVQWHDAHADSSWLCVEDFDDEPCVVVSVGMIVPNAKAGHITIVQSYNDCNVDNVIHIPEAMVVSVKKVGKIKQLLNG